MNTMHTPDTKEGAELTAQDRDVLAKYLDRHEKTARRWLYTRYLTLAFLGLLYFNGFRSFLPAYHDSMTSFDEEAYIKQLRNSPIPSDDLTARQWLAGYTTKVAVIAAFDRKAQSASLLLGIGGAIMLTVALICTIFLIGRWNDGERDIVMVRFIRHYVQKQPG